jgi:hypothetical protein
MDLRSARVIGDLARGKVERGGLLSAKGADVHWNN